MRVLHSGTLSASVGGPAMSTYLTLKGLQSLGVDAEIIQYELENGDVLRGNEVPIHFASHLPNNKFGYSHAYKKAVSKISDVDIYHAQGIWQYPTYALIDVARKHNKPYVITPRGMLYPQDIRKSNRFFKQLSLFCRLRNDFNRAACVHVTCEEEMRHCRRLGITSPMAVIPNPCDVGTHTYTKYDAIFRIGYLGRISPRKNIEGLIYALNELRSKTENTELLVIGGGDVQYEDFLRKEGKRLALNNIKFTGFLSGEEKDKAIASCSIIVMPSEFENFGNVILEGLIRGIPCIATKGAPWEDLNTYHCGWWVDYNQNAITEAIYKAYNSPAELLKKMGENGKNLVKKKYSVESVASKLKMTYDWVLGNADQPDFVHTGITSR